MECAHHRNRDATNTCYKCGNWICDDCVMDAGGRILCRACAGERSHHTPVRPHRTNGFFFFILSCTVPGINFMYLGLMKRGLFLLSSFFLTITMLAMFEVWPLAFVLAIMYISNFFDGYTKRRKINCGEYVPDSVEDIMSFVRRYKYHMIMVLGGFMVLNILSNVYRSMRYNMWIHNQLPAIVPVICILAIIYGVYMVGKSKGKRRKDDDGQF